MNWADRCFLILSDIEMGRGGPEDDFPHSNYLSKFISEIDDSRNRYSQMEIDLVFNGDTFDFLKTPIDGKYPHLIDERTASAKFDLIEKAHNEFFETLRNFLANGSKPRRIHFIAGNHDPEIWFPAIQSRIINSCGGSGQVLFPGYELKVGDLIIEHGSQHDSMFQMDANTPFVNYNGRKVLNLPWASVTLLNVMMPAHKLLYELDRIKPKRTLFEQLPELKEWTMMELWNYWTKDYIKDVFRSGDPLKKLSWLMLKEMVKRSISFNPDIELNEYIKKQVSQDDQVKAFVVGHTHEPKVWSYGDRKYIRSGCFRDEFMLSESSDTYSYIPKSYTEVFFRSNRVVSVNLMEIPGPEINKERYPKPISHYRPIIREHLGSPEQRVQSKKDIEEQERKEEEGERESAF